MHARLIPLAEQLKSHVPRGTEIKVAELIIQNHIHLTVTRHRTTKYGDYRPPMGGKGHRISINHSLNPYSFLITFVHELAHLTCWNQYKNRVAPHGKEWKQHFQVQIQPFLSHHVFPETIMKALSRYKLNPAASSCADVNLLKALQEFQPADGLNSLEELPENQVFLLDDNKLFKKGPLERKRYRCLNLHNKRYYFVNALARVKPVDQEGFA